MQGQTLPLTRGAGIEGKAGRIQELCDPGQVTESSFLQL